MNETERSNRNSEGRQYGMMLAGLVSPFAFIGGFISCVRTLDQNNIHWWDPLIFLIISTVISYGIGFYWGFNSFPK